MNVAAPGREADGSRFHRCANQIPHFRDIVIGRVFIGNRPVAHDINPQRVMADVNGDIDRALPRFEGIHVVGEAVPVPRQTLGQRGAGYVLDPFHQLDQAIMVCVVDRGESNAAIAHHRGRDTVADGWLEPIIPRRLSVVVAVQIDEAGRDDASGGIDGSGGVAELRPDLRDLSAGHGNVGTDRNIPVSVKHEAAGDFQIKAHEGSLPDTGFRPFQTRNAPASERPDTRCQIAQTAVTEAAPPRPSNWARRMTRPRPEF